MADNSLYGAKPLQLLPTPQPQTLRPLPPPQAPVDRITPPEIDPSSLMDENDSLRQNPMERALARTARMINPFYEQGYDDEDVLAQTASGVVLRNKFTKRIRYVPTQKPDLYETMFDNHPDNPDNPKYVPPADEYKL